MRVASHVLLDVSMWHPLRNNRERFDLNAEEWEDIGVR